MFRMTPMRPRPLGVVLAVGVLGGGWSEARENDGDSGLRGGRRHVFAILMDDLGWDDVGWHNSRSGLQEAVSTPALDALVREGIELDRAYAFAVCVFLQAASHRVLLIETGASGVGLRALAPQSPSRSAIQSGRDPVHVNSENLDPLNCNARDVVSGFSGVPCRMRALGAVMRDAGSMTTHYYGKWDVGMATPRHTPRGRGYARSLVYFHHMVNYWRPAYNNPSGSTDFFDTCRRARAGFRPLDLWAGNATYEGPALDVAFADDCSPGDFDLCTNESACPAYPSRNASHCIYLDDLFTRAVLEAAAETGDVGGADHADQGGVFVFWAPHAAHAPLQLPEPALERYAAIDDWRRRRYVATVAAFDAAVGAVVDALRRAGSYDATLIAFASDNGGPVYAAGAAGASNYPLRGGKATNLDGGIRVSAFVSGGLVPPKRRGMKFGGLVAIWDWYATFAEVVGGPSFNLTDAEAAAYGLPAVDAMSQWGYWSGATRSPPRTRVVVGGAKAVEGIIEDLGSAGLWKLVTGTQHPAGWQGPSFPNATTGDLGSLDCRRGCVFRLDTDPGEHVDLATREPEMHRRLEAARVDAERRLGDHQPGPFFGGGE